MLKRLGVLALIFSAGAMFPAAAFAQNGYRDGGYYRDGRRGHEYRESRRYEDRGRAWREHERAERYYGRSYYGPAYSYAPNYYYSPRPNYYYAPAPRCPYPY